jgi:hypothetical protein
LGTPEKIAVVRSQDSDQLPFPTLLAGVSHVSGMSYTKLSAPVWDAKQVPGALLHALERFGSQVEPSLAQVYSKFPALQIEQVLGQASLPPGETE